MIRYWVDNDHDTHVGSPHSGDPTAEFATCEYEVTGTTGHFHCPFTPLQTGTFWFDIMLINPVAIPGTDPEEFEETGPLISIKNPIPKKTLGFSFWFEVTE